jgi:hypothetical protein
MHKHLPWSIFLPEELAWLGVDNDELLCNLCTRPLSSIIPAANQAAHRLNSVVSISDTLTQHRSDLRWHTDITRHR